MIGLRLVRPWLVVDLGRPMRVLGWALNRPGFATASRLVWREVRDADLPEDLDADRWLAGELASAGLEDAPCLVTSSDIGRHLQRSATIAGVTAEAVVTVGLSNAERIGHRRAPVPAFGTINVAVVLDAALSDGAMVEALSLVAEARTAAVIAHGPVLGEGPATGTGTDCIVLACPAGAVRHAGKHTAIGEAVGRAVVETVTQGVVGWMAGHRAP